MSSRMLTSTLRQSTRNLGKTFVANNLRMAPQLVRSSPILISKFNYSTTPDKQLKEVLKQELKLSNSIPNELDPVYQEFANKSGYKVIETEGNSNIQLVKEDESGETIRIFFDIDEVTDIPVSEPTAEEMDMEEEVESLDSLLCNVRVLIEKPNSNDGLLLNLFLQASESSFLIDFVNYQNNVSTLLNDQILSKNEFIDKFKYQGPRFSDLDESVQTGFETYLQSKGIDDELAEFIISFSEFKEEKEYRNWLSDLTKFLN